MKKLSLLWLLSLMLLVSCVSTQVGVRDDVPLADLAAVADEALANPALTAMEDNYLKSMQLDTDLFEGYVVKLATQGTTIDEYGIFLAPDVESAPEVSTAIEDYLQFRLDIWMPEYLPEEFPKLESAQVATYGRYVVYGILSEVDQEALFAAVEAALVS